MTQTEFRDAARKGKGRAIEVLRAREYQASVQEICRVILSFPGVDPVCELSRAWYTVELIEASGHKEALTSLAVRSLSHKNHHHRRGIVLELAKRDAVGAKAAIYSSFDAKNDFQAADEILELDGLDGLNWILTHSAGELLPAKAGTFGRWIDDLGKACGPEAVTEWLRKESGRAEVAEFARLSALEVRRPAKPPSAPALCYQDFRKLDVAHDKLGMAIRRWVRTASDAELKVAWHALETENDPEWMRLLGHALSSKPAHCDIDKFIELAQAWGEKDNWYAQALGDIRDPRLRPLGFALLGRKDRLDGIRLLANNAQPGDEAAVLAEVLGLQDRLDIHSAGLDLLRLDEGLDIREILLWIYEATPCSLCRGNAVERLVKRNSAPRHLLQECLLDCDPETRQAAESALASLASSLTTE